jgi:hypothetical protein
MGRKNSSPSIMRGLKMNINIIQSGQISQKVISAGDQGNYGSETRTNSLSDSALSISKQEPAITESAIPVGISYLKEQLDQLLTSYPPFFPVGSYQRADLIRGIRSLEEKIGKSATGENIKTLFSGKRLSENASDHEISVSLDRLLAVKDKLTGRTAIVKEAIKPGTLLDIKI